MKAFWDKILGIFTKKSNMCAKRRHTEDKSWWRILTGDTEPRLLSAETAATLRQQHLGGIFNDQIVIKPSTVKNENNTSRKIRIKKRRDI